MNVMLWLVKKKSVEKHCSTRKPLTCVDLDSWRLPACRCCRPKGGIWEWREFHGAAMSSQPTSQAAAATISLHNGWKSKTPLKTLWDVRGEELSCITTHPQEQLTLLQQSRNSVLNIKESSLKWGMPRDNAQNTIFFSNFQFLLLKPLLRCLLWQDLPWKNLTLPPKKPQAQAFPPHTHKHTQAKHRTENHH